MNKLILMLFVAMANVEYGADCCVACLQYAGNGCSNCGSNKRKRGSTTCTTCTESGMGVR